MKNPKIFTPVLTVLFLFIMASFNAISASEPGDKLIEIIKEQQDLSVKMSCNQSSCFTDNDNSKFIANRVVDMIKEELKADPDFKTVVEEISKMPDADRTALFARAKRTYKKTWAEIGRISCEGQTDAGQQAEKRIAYGITKLAQSMIASR